MPFPDFFLLGAGKAGTTTLTDHLGAHPEITISTPPETWFLDGPEYELGQTVFTERHFPGWSGSGKAGEASSCNLFLPFLPERIRNWNPEAKLIAILRNPIERALSHWWMYYCFGTEPESFSEAVRINLSTLGQGTGFAGPAGIRDWYAEREKERVVTRVYLEYGHYAEQLTRYLEVFPEDQLRVVLLEDLRSDREGVLRSLFQFLEVDDAYELRGEEVRGERYSSRGVFRLTNLVVKTGVQYLVPRRARRRISHWLRTRSSAA